MTDAIDTSRTDPVTTAGSPSCRAGFREVMRSLAGTVGVVAALDDRGRPVGMTVSSLTSVSLEPPLALFCPALTSRTWPLLRAADGLCVSILNERQQDLSRKFAGAENRFAGVSWTPSPGGMPVLGGSVAWLECSVADAHRAGDHHIVVVRLHHTGSSGGGPLLRHRGRYARLAAPGEGLPPP
ncbi:flavin reductase family protein [Streptomyces avidinii]|uniref:flavin reductase family protein n=1 Tax=Streptomyces avidinii TaxID=1895 RepID=UPI0038708350|nr:flavin reductase family protein [Streptomyces avidinii]